MSVSSLLPLLQVKPVKKTQLKASYYTTRGHWCIIICLRLTNHTYQTLRTLSMLWMWMVYEVTGGQKSASWMWPWALARRHHSQSQPHAFLSTKTIAHHDQAGTNSNLLQSGTLLHFFSTTTTQKYSGCIWHGCRSNAASSNDTLRTTWGMVPIGSV